ncbi:hypothetical protein BH23PLA1_BH23PLA1_43200 [soil metagenome]
MTRLFLVVGIRNGCGNQQGKVGGNGSMLELQPFGRPLPLLIVDLSVHPVSKKTFFVSGQFHQGPFLQHMCNRSEVGACRAL